MFNFDKCLMIILLIMPATTFTQDSPLPFRLITFDGDRMGSMKNHLYWTTFSEYKSNQFKLQRETQEQPFTTIGIIEAKGNTERITKYAFIDDHPTSGINYYRLKLVDQDNSFNYSKIIAVENQSMGQEILLYPNLTLDYIHLLYEADQDETGDLRIVNYSGQVLYYTNYSSTNGTNRMTIDVQDLPTGRYALQTIRDGVLVTKTFLKQ